MEPGSKRSGWEMDLKYPDNSTRRRTELADEPACCGQAKTGQDGKADFRFPTNRRQRRNGANLATAFRAMARTWCDSNQPNHANRVRAIRGGPESTRRARRAPGNPAYFFKPLSFS